MPQKGHSEDARHRTPSGSGRVARPHSGGPVGRAVRWATLSQVIRQFVQLTTVVVLARTLTPSDFGLVTVALVVIGFLTLFRDLSLGSAVIQRAEISHVLLSSMFWVAVGTGSLVFGAVFLLAPWISLLLNEPLLEGLLRVLALSFVLTGIGVVHQALLERGLQYSSVARAEMLAVSVGSVVSIALAVGGAGVWSLVAQVLIVAALTSILVWLSCPWRPSLVFDVSAARAGGGFGAGLTTYNLVNYLARNADYAIIGRTLGTEALGYYTMAYRMMLFPIQIVTAVVNRVMFPGLSRLRNDGDAMSALYLAGVASVAFAAFPIALGLASVSGRLLPLALGPGWEPAVPVAILLSVVGLFQTVGGSVGPVFLARGAIRSMVIWGVVSTTLVIAGFAIGIQWGITGVAASYVLVSIALLYPSLVVALGPVGIGIRSIAAVVWRSLLVAVLMSGCVLGAGAFLEGRVPEVATLGVQMMTGVTSYVGLSYALNRYQFRLFLRRVWRAS